MTYSLIIKPEAELDILNTSNWYEEKQQDLGLRFLDEVEDKLNLITANPYQYQERYKNTRFALIKHFPYAIHFIVEKSTVVVLAILGTREDPEKWP
ncbi:MAG: type II toxin-antitoxin system RelE/ParE family toxin [Fulvivirga sp.]|uniref:type II toxin-antitoxin system RelE/ParE family toxin n=1 Tax=Fulvivirga sp. TaxID=1931237 RepID=UPI0032EE84C6